MREAASLVLIKSPIAPIVFSIADSVKRNNSTEQAELTEQLAEIFWIYPEAG